MSALLIVVMFWKMIMQLKRCYYLPLCFISFIFLECGVYVVSASITSIYLIVTCVIPLNCMFLVCRGECGRKCQPGGSSVDPSAWMLGPCLARGRWWLTEGHARWLPHVHADCSCPWSRNCTLSAGCDWGGGRWERKLSHAKVGHVWAHWDQKQYFSLGLWHKYQALGL